MEYKISQRPYPQNQYNLDYITAANAFKNPWAGLGALLGAVLTKNYVDRGEKKLMDSMKDSIPQQQENTDAQITQQMLSNRPTQEETGKQALWDAYKKGNQIEIQPNYEIGLEALKNKSTDPLETAALQRAIQSGNPQTNEPSQNDLNASQFEKDYLQKYINGNLPHMDAQGNLSNMGNAEALQAQRQQAAAQIAQNSIPKFSTEDWEAKMWAEGKKQGRPDYQIQAVIDRMKPQAQQAEKRYNDKQIERYTNQFFNNLPDANGEGGDQAATLDALVEIAKIDPKQAQILATERLSTRDRINLSDKRRAQNFKENQAVFDNNLKAIKLMSGSGSSRSSGSGGYVTANGVPVPKELSKLAEQLNYQVSAGIKTQEEANKEFKIAQRQLGMNKEQIEKDNIVSQLLETVDAGVKDVETLYASRDVSTSGNLLEKITQLIDENPEVWDSFSNEEKLVINSRRYYINCMREIAAGNEEMARQYAKAIPPYIAEREGWNLSNENIRNLVNNYNALYALDKKKAEEEQKKAEEERKKAEEAKKKAEEDSKKTEEEKRIEREEEGLPQYKKDINKIARKLGINDQYFKK